MNEDTEPHAAFTQSDIHALAAPMKIGVLATVNPEWLPHALFTGLTGAELESPIL